MTDLPYSWPDFDTMQGMFTWSNEVTDGMFAPIIVVVVWAVAFNYLQAYKTEQAFLAANFIALLTGTLLLFGGIMPEFMVVALAILTGISVLWNMI